MRRPEVTGWLSRMPDSIAMWLLGGLFSLLAGLIIEVAILHVQVDNVRGDLREVKTALGIGVQHDPAGRENDGARTAALGR